MAFEYSTSPVFTVEVNDTSTAQVTLTTHRSSTTVLEQVLEVSNIDAKSIVAIKRVNTGGTVDNMNVTYTNGNMELVVVV